jgi:hypothetical protein
VTVLRCDHHGSNHARNRIVAESRGDWVQFLDADDYLEPGKIETQFTECAQVEETDVIYSPFLTAEGGTVTQSRLDIRRDLFSQWISWELPQTGGALWRRDALQSIGGWNETMPCCQEHELYLRAIQAGLRFSFTPTALAVYRVWSDETLCRRDPSLVVETKTRLIDSLRDWMIAHDLWRPEHAEVAGRACFEMARTLAKNDIARAAAYYRQRQRAGLIRVTGPAAPASYRFVRSVLGFAGAEKLARALR